MSSEFLIVNKKILPDYLDKVIYARNLLQSQEAKTITEAVQKAGISRNTYYKYKDHVYSMEEKALQRQIVLSIILKDESGALSSVLSELSKLNTSILTISQTIPVAGKANLLVSLDIARMNCSVEELIQDLKALSTVRAVHLDAME